MNKLYSTLFIALLTVGFTACNNDDCDELHLDNLAHFPNVLKGSFPTENQVLDLGKTLEITPELLDPTGATFSWLVNGKEVSTEPTFTYKIENPCRADLTCIITNKYGKVEMKTSFSSNHDFSKGFFYVADGTFNFYDTEKKVTYKDCYGSLNAGKKITSASNSLYIATNNGKFYVMAGTNSVNEEHFFVVDARTLYYENSAIVDAGLTGLTLLNDQYALIGGDGVRRIDLKSLNNVQLLDKHLYSIYNGLVYNGKLLANDTYGDASKVKLFNVSELLAAKAGEMPVAEELNITQKQKINFVMAKDGNAYTIESTDDGCNIVRINKGFITENIPADFKPAKGPYWSSPTVGMIASATENAIYIPSENGAVYKYVIGDANSLKNPFIAANESGLPVAATLQLNQQSGELYVIYGKKWEDYKIVVYTKDGQASYTVDCGESAPSYILFNN